MRKVVISNIISVDGCFTGPGGDVMAMPFGPGFSEYNAARLREADTLLLGRTTYEGFRDYWPPVADDPQAPELEREISRLNGAIPKLVVSDTLPENPPGAWAATTRVVRRAEAHGEVAALRKEDGRDVLIFGSRLLWNDLLDHGLVDELHFMIGPGIVGGVPAFARRPAVTLELLESRVLDDAGLVLLRYAVHPDAGRSERS
jgi:dihydrofolate reductase